MATDVMIDLQYLKCISLGDSKGRSPYFWAALLWIDDNTLQTPDLVGVEGPYYGDARVVVKDNMHAGEQADIPYPVGFRSVRFEDSLNIRQMILVVAMFEKHDTPYDALWAGCQAFTNELRAAIADNLLALMDDQQRQDAIATVKTRVTNSIRSAILNALGWWDKSQVLIGELQLDTPRGSDFSYFPDPTPVNINLSFEDGSNCYEILGTLTVRVPSIDLCQAQVDAANAAKRVVDSINSQISAEQQNYINGSPADKSAIKAELQQLDDALAGAQANLDEANQALKACRDHYAQVVQKVPKQPIPAAIGTF